MNNNFNNDIDYLALFGTFLGVLNYMENIKQTSNDELLEELKNLHPRIQLRGFHSHIGSQIFEKESFYKNIEIITV